MKLFFSLMILFTIGATSHAQDERTELISKGDDARRAMNYKEAISYYEKAFIVDQKNKDKTQMVFDLMFIGESYISQSDMEQSISNYLEALKISESIEDDKNPQVQVLANISFYFMKFKNLDKAKEYLEKAHELIAEYELSNYSNRKYYNLLGLVEKQRNKLEASVDAYKRSLEFSEQPHDILLGLNNISDVYLRNARYEDAFHYLKRAETYNDSAQIQFWSMIIPMRMGQYYGGMNNHKKAIEYCLIAWEEAKTSENIHQKKDILYQLSESYAKIGNHEKAHESHLRYTQELIAMQKTENSRAIAEMEAKYEHEKKERKISTLEKEKTLKSEIHNSQMDRRNLLIFIAVFGLLITIIISALVMRNQRNKQRLKLELVENQKEIAKQQSELKGQEIERNRISRELHDGLGGTLASIKMRLNSEEHNLHQPILKDIDRACIDVRNISHSLNSSLIEETVFYSLMKRLCDDIEMRSEMNVNLEFTPTDDLNKLGTQQKHHSYRIIQELTNNVIKHAQANEVTIGFIKDNDEVIVLIEDDGLGFDLKGNTSGIGLNNVRKRLKEINGKMEVRSTPNHGTNFTIRFPYTSKTT